MSMLEVDAINSFYGDSHVLFDISLRVEEHEVVALLGRNGAGKTTTLNTIAGIIAPRSGSIRFGGTPIEGLASHVIARRGLQLVPEERRIFITLTVEENLQLAALNAPEAKSMDEIFSIFPRLRERRKATGGTLSGGEQQMLAIARALIRSPRLILLDEPFEGLAPVIVEDLVTLCGGLAEAGTTIVIVEQDVRSALELARRVYVLNNGHVVFEGTRDALLADPEITSRYLGMGLEIAESLEP
ncbi:MAG TPA: ABC transporter ATP-binding protein [Acetobacteraceae bacterium]|jgi:branched-chain amino acid transport system ATP-binding protein|nr:ABC transporter ATP-binding protein [Acetobacteraceae bacterium]HEX4369429.1 ABC transporter ATP-binding protein [Rhodopila sp.]